MKNIIILLIVIASSLADQAISQNPMGLIIFGAEKGLGALKESGDKRKAKKALIANLERHLTSSEAKIAVELTQRDIDSVTVSFDRLFSVEPKKASDFSERVNNIKTKFKEGESERAKIAAQKKIENEKIEKQRRIEAERLEYRKLLAETYDNHISPKEKIQNIKRIQALCFSAENELVFPDTLYSIQGVAYFETEMFKDAVVDLERYFSISEKYKTFNLQKVFASSLAKIGRFEDALKICNDLIVLRPDEPELLYLRYTIFKGNEQFDEAITEIERLAEQKQNNTKYNLEAATLNFFMKDFESAAKYYSKITTQGSATLDVYENLGFCQTVFNDKNKAIEYYSQSKALGNKKVDKIIDDLKNDVAFVNGNDIPMYTENSKKSKIIAYLHSGTKVITSEVKNGLTRIYVENIGAYNGAGGWIDAKNTVLNSAIITTPNKYNTAYTLPTNSPLGSIPASARSTRDEGSYISSQQYYRGRRGGCYYITSSGKKEYVARSMCD